MRDEVTAFGNHLRHPRAIIARPLWIFRRRTSSVAGPIGNEHAPAAAYERPLRCKMLDAPNFTATGVSMNENDQPPTIAPPIDVDAVKEP